MAVLFKGKKWSVTRPANELDKFVLSFARFLEAQGTRYVLVSGYVSILFGRSRNSEDVDVFIEPLDRQRFKEFWRAALEEYDSVTVSDADDAFDNYLSAGLSLRLARKGRILPNMELKFPKDGLADWSLEHSVDADLNGGNLKIAPLELQIPYKLYLGSEKDVEDALHLWHVCRDNLDLGVLNGFVALLKQGEAARKWLK